MCCAIALLPAKTIPRRFTSQPWSAATLNPQNPAPYTRHPCPTISTPLRVFAAHEHGPAGLCSPALPRCGSPPGSPHACGVHEPAAVQRSGSYQHPLVTGACGGPLTWHVEPAAAAPAGYSGALGLACRHAHRLAEGIMLELCCPHFRRVMSLQRATSALGLACRHAHRVAEDVMLELGCAHMRGTCNHQQQPSERCCSACWRWIKHPPACKQSPCL